MAQADLVVQMYKAVGGMLAWHLADFSEAEMFVRPTPTANHAAYQLVHVLGFDMMVANALGAPAFDLPAKFKTVSGKEAASIDDPTAFPTKDELLALNAKVLAATITALEKATDAQLATESPPDVRPFAATLGVLASIVPAHEGMHIGQIQVIRRKLGKPHLF